MTGHWGVRVGPGGKYAEVARKGGFVAIEWHELGDLTWLAQADDEDHAWRKLVEQYKAAYSVAGAKASAGADQINRFVREIRDGDYVLTPHTAANLVYLGRVKGSAPVTCTRSPRCLPTGL